MSLQQKVSSAIRILRWNRDVSARASHLVEVIHNFQAESENVSDSTVFFERKLMSTKTSIKRIAAVAAVALTIGGFSAVSAHAATGDLNVTVDSASHISGLVGTGVAGAYNFVQVTLTPSATTGAQYVVGVTGGTASTSATSVVGSGTASLLETAPDALATPVTLTVPTPVVGTITLKSFAVVGGVVSATASSTAVITVAAALPGTVYNHSSAFIGANGVPVTADAAASALTASSTAGSVAVAEISVKQYASSDTATTIASGSSTAVTVSVSGAGSVDAVSGGTSRGPSATAIAGGAYNSEFYLFPDGRAGTSTITVTVNGAVVATKTFTFVGSATKYVFDNVAADAIQDTNYKTYIPVAGSGTLTVTAADANGNEAAVGTISSATSSNTAVATVAITTNVSLATTAVLTVTGVSAGTANITITDGATTSPKTLVIPVRVTGTTVAKVTLAFDSSSYAPGQKFTLTASAFTAAGDPVADGSRALWTTAPSFNTITQGTVLVFNATAETVAGGVVTWTGYAPVVTGALTISGTDSTSAAAAVTATADVTSTTDAAAQAAVDAAQEATDAANAAYDAANNAMDSADAATAAAQDASDNASAALAAVTSLSATVAKLVSSVTAIATALASIKKKLGVK